MKLGFIPLWKKIFVFLFHLCQWANTMLHFIISALWVGCSWIRETPLIVVNSKTWKPFSYTGSSTEAYLQIFCKILLFLSFLVTIFLTAALHLVRSSFVAKVWCWCTWQYGVQGKSFHYCRWLYMFKNICFLAEIDMLFLIYINFSLLAWKALLYDWMLHISFFQAMSPWNWVQYTHNRLININLLLEQKLCF